MKGSKTSSDDVLDAHFRQYAKRGSPIRVDFRRLQADFAVDPQGPHLLHPYPAKLLAHIPHFFLQSQRLSSPGDLVLDPFCGSGTVLLEALLAGRNAVGADSNPLARLITRVKTRPLDVHRLARSVGRLLGSVPHELDVAPPDVVNLKHWYHPRVVRQLCRLREAVRLIRKIEEREFFELCFSVLARRVSLADPRLTVPVRLRPERLPDGHWLQTSARERLRSLRRIDVTEEFSKIVWQNVDRLRNLSASFPQALEIPHIGNDARRIEGRAGALQSGTVRLAITSPPYVGAQKYVRASSLNLGWLGLATRPELRALEDLNIGREHFPVSATSALTPTRVPAADRMLRDIRRHNPLRAHIAATYLVEMRAALIEVSRVLAPGGHLVLVAANNTVCGREFRTQAYLQTIAEQAGLTTRLRLTDVIRSRGLMTTRNRTAGIIAREWVHIFEKSR